MSEQQQLTKYQEAVLAEIVSAVGDPGATMGTIAEQLGRLYDEAEKRGDGDTLGLISSSWSYVQLMSTQQGVAMNLAAAAREIAEITQQQLEQVRGEHEALLEAIDEGDEGHPLLVEYANTVREDGYEQAYNSMEEDAISMAFEHVDEVMDEALGEFAQKNNLAMGWNARAHVIAKMRGELVWEARQAALWMQICEIEMALQKDRDLEQQRRLNEFQARQAAREQGAAS